MSSSIILQPVSAMRPQTTACCFCCLSAFNGLAFVPACLSVCVCVCAARTVCGCPDITSLHFELQDVEGVREVPQKTKRDGGAKNKVKRKTKDGWKRGGWETGVIKKFLSTSALLSPACARRPRPRSSPEFHSCQGTKPGCRPGGRGVSSTAGLSTTNSQTGVHLQFPETMWELLSSGLTNLSRQKRTLD